MKLVPQSPTAANAPRNAAWPGAFLRGPWSGTWVARMRFAILTFLIWTAVGAFETVPESFRGFHWYMLLAKVVEAWGWALLTPAVLLIDRTLKASRQNGLNLLFVYLPLSIPFSIVHTFLVGLLLYPIPIIWFSPIREASFAVYYLVHSWTTFCAFVGILQAFNFYNRFLSSELKLERVEKRLIESRLNTLRLQLEPHFLFNALNAISSEVVANPELVQEMIEDLAVLLRRSIDCQDSTEIMLAQELALLDHYLAIQKLRFGKRLDIRIDAEPATLSAMVPSMLLQPLVENAIRHGIERRISGGMIAISARLTDDQLRIEVLDDGVGLPPNWRMEASSGLGLRVTRERLEALYSEPAEHNFIISPRKSGGTHVTVRIPLHRMGVEADDNPV